jgi:quercetin dioxygenase-like cupin family protein
MKTAHITDFVKGWFVGNFEPSLLKSNFEVGLHTHTKGEFHQDHFHKLGTEINLIVEGQLMLNGKIFGPGDIVVLEPYDISQSEYLTDVKLVVVKSISDPTDKYEIEIK